MQGKQQHFRFGQTSCMMRVASRPFSPGMETSMITISGEFTRQANRFLSVVGFSAKIPFRVDAQYALNAAADHRMIVHD